MVILVYWKGKTGDRRSRIGDRGLIMIMIKNNNNNNNNKNNNNNNNNRTRANQDADEVVIKFPANELREISFYLSNLRNV